MHSKTYQIQELQYYKQQHKVNACIIFFKCEQIEASTLSQYFPVPKTKRILLTLVPLTSQKYTFILLSFWHRYMNLCKQHSVADLLEYLVGKA